MPEVYARNMEELMESIEKVFQRDECREKRLERRSYHFDDIDGHSCERLYHAIKRLCDN